MLILEYKLRTNQAQRAAIDEAIRTTQFVRNKALCLWMDSRGVGQYQLQALCSQLAKEYPLCRPAQFDGSPGRRPTGRGRR